MDNGQRLTTLHSAVSAIADAKLALRSGRTTDAILARLDVALADVKSVMADMNPPTPPRPAWLGYNGPTPPAGQRPSIPVTPPQRTVCTRQGCDSPRHIAGQAWVYADGTCFVCRQRAEDCTGHTCSVVFGTAAQRSASKRPVIKLTPWGQSDQVNRTL